MMEVARRKKELPGAQPSDGTQGKSGAVAGKARGVPVPRHGGGRDLRGQGAIAAQSGAVVFSGVAVDGRQDRFAGAGDRGAGNDRGGKRARSAGAREPTDQTVQTEIQRDAAGRQDLS